MKEEIQRQAVLGLRVDSSFCSVILCFPSCSQNGCCIFSRHIRIPDQREASFFQLTLIHFNEGN